MICDNSTSTAVDRASVSDKQHLHMICEEWALWSRTRRIYGPSPKMKSLLGALQKRSYAVNHDGLDAACSAELAAFHLSVLAQPEDLSRAVFEAHFVLRVRNIKAASRTLGISRAKWYRLLLDFQIRANGGAQAIMDQNKGAMGGFYYSVGNVEQGNQALADTQESAPSMQAA